MAHHELVHPQPAHPQAGAAAHEQPAPQHPLGIYLWIWGLLFVLSVFSYLVDYIGFEGLLRWGLIVLFMLLKAGLIVSVFMHMMWERLAIVCAILIPPGAILVLTLLMALEANYTLLARLTWYFS